LIGVLLYLIVIYVTKTFSKVMVKYDAIFFVISGDSELTPHLKVRWVSRVRCGREKLSSYGTRLHFGHS